MTSAAAAELERLGGEYFTLVHTLAPFTATQLGVSGFDALVPDPSREGAARGAAQIAAVEQRLQSIDTGQLDDAGRTDAAVLAHLAGAARSDLEQGLWEANPSAGGYVSPAATMLQSVPAALLGDPAAAGGYLERLRGLPGFLDAVTARYRQAVAGGRNPAQAGVRQAIDQLAGHLARDLASDPLVAVALPATARPGGMGAAAVRERAAGIVAGQVRPAMQRLLDCLRQDLLPVARPDDQAGICFVPGGEEGYLAAVRQHTTTGLTPEQIHQTGLDCLAALREEWAELGGRVLGIAGLSGILARLRDDPALRFGDTGQIVRTVTGALARAEAARDQWFPRYEIPDCVVEEIDPVEAGNAALAYYRPPAAGGVRPGAFCVLTARPAQRFGYEYEALSFHESTPGHHLQIASAQTLALPAYRRFLDAEVCGYVEGWGLYCERLADEMGLYTSDLQRLGMLSFDALRACRLVVDTGMHYYGWSRARAADFMWRHTATTRANVENEISRYIGWPGQALAYMTGRREIQRLRGLAERALGPRFDVRAFHGTVLGQGAVPLAVLEQLVTRWVDYESRRLRS
ncbi:MAG: hypothetical protein QOG05_1205 [Streptosporangiaceae bacterium]|nr:hypothetical protein [Streptosporangiaceae bacterium]